MAAGKLAYAGMLAKMDLLTLTDVLAAKKRKWCRVPFGFL